MNEPKPLASLSPSLLARKGGARPAMRPQLIPLTFDDQRRMGYSAPASALAAAMEDDLGWNDMGVDVPATELTAAGFSAAEPAADVVAIASGPLPAPTQPEVLRRIESLEGAMRPAPSPAPSPALSRAPAPDMLAAAVPKAAPTRRPRGSALKDGRKAAFTLRLDGERHLQLRLACTIDDCSAQQLVVEALDRFLETKPGLADLARRVRQS